MRILPLSVFKQVAVKASNAAEKMFRYRVRKRSPNFKMQGHSKRSREDP